MPAGRITNGHTGPRASTPVADPATVETSSIAPMRTTAPRPAPTPTMAARTISLGVSPIRNGRSRSLIRMHYQGRELRGAGVSSRVQAGSASTLVAMGRSAGPFAFAEEPMRGHEPRVVDLLDLHQRDPV